MSSTPLASLHSSRAALVAFFTLAPLSVFAQTNLYWGGGTADIANGTAVTDTAGTWGASTLNWATDSSGTTYQAWENGAIANFVGGTGTVSLNTGTRTVGGLVFGTGNRTFSAGSMAFTSGAAVSVPAGTTVSFNGVSLTGSTGFTKTGAGGLALYTNDSGTSGFTGTITHDGGVLQVRNGNAIGRAATVTVGGGATLSFQNGSNTTYGSVTRLAVVVQDNASTLTISSGRSTGSNTGSVNTLGTLSLGARTVAFTQSSYTTSSFVFDTTTLTGDSTLSVSSGMGVTLGAVSETGGARDLTKIGAGSLTLSGHNTYTGDTTVNVGTLTVGSAGSLFFDLQNGGLTNSVKGTGTINFDGAFRLDLAGISDTSGTWHLVDTSTLLESFAGTFSVQNADGSVTFSNSGGIWTYTTGSQLWTFSQVSGDLSLAVSNVPEPAAAAVLMGLGGLAAAGARRRRFQSR